MCVNHLGYGDVDDRFGYPGNVSVLIHVEAHLRFLHTTHGTEILPVYREQGMPINTSYPMNGTK